MPSLPVPLDPDSDATIAKDAAPATDAVATAPHGGSPDPITGEPDAHPVGVGVGAGVAGVAGAAIGAFAGPIGIVVGAAIGAIAGGLAGKEAAEAPEVSPISGAINPLDEFDHPAAGATTAGDDVPLTSAMAERVIPHEDAFFTGGSLSGKDPDLAGDALDDFDRPHAVASTSTASAAGGDRPLPTASSGLITPDESRFFADSATGESSVLTESPFPAAHAVSPGDNFAGVPAVPVRASSGQANHPGQSELEDLVRTTAYYRYLHREEKGQPGSAFDDWVEAEQEVRLR